MTATSTKSVATLSDVAAKSGMSLGTVSRILRDGGNFREETRRRVLDVAEELNYRPNLLVRAMQTGRTGTVGVAIALGDEFFSRVAVGIHDRLVDAGSLPVFAWTRVTSTLEDESKTEERRQIHRLIERRVDGVILRPHRDTVTDEYLKEVWERNLPLVAIDQELEKTQADFVGTDDEAGGRLAAEHLLSLGHRRVAHIAGPDLVSTSRRRRRGFEETIRAGGGTCVSLEDPSFGRFESVSGEIDVATQLLNTTPRPTAVFAVNDYMAAAVYDAAAERGLRIPDDLSVVGFADLKHVRLLRPTLTTIRQCPEEIGREAAQLVLGRLDGKFDRAPQKRLLPVTLVSRASTAPPAST